MWWMWCHGGEEGGRAERTGLTELWRTFVREKFNSIPFINIKTSQSYHLLPELLYTKPSVCDLSHNVIMGYEDVKATHYILLTLHLLYCVFPLMMLYKLYAMLDIHLESEDPQKASFYLLSVPLPSSGWSKKLPLCWEYFFRLHKKRKWKHNICMAHSPQPENFITSQTHIFWQLNRGDTFPFLDLGLCWKKKIRMELASCIPM